MNPSTFIREDWKCWHFTEIMKYLWFQIKLTSQCILRSLCFPWELGTTWLAAYAGEEVKKKNKHEPLQASVARKWGLKSKLFLWIWQGYEGSDLKEVLKEVKDSQQIPLDRWSIKVTPKNPQDAGDPVPYEIMNNYFSIGVVRGIAQSFMQFPQTQTALIDLS